MKRLMLVFLTSLALVTAGCGTQTAQQACADHGGLRANSIEVDAHDHDRDGNPDGEAGGEGRCKDGAEVENVDGADPNTGYWEAED